MVLSDKQTLPKGRNLIGGNTGDSRHNPIKQKDKMRSYAQALKSNQERDCFDLERKTTDELGQLTEGGQLFLHAKDKHSIVIDIDQFNEANVNFKDLGVLFREQYPYALGLRVRTATKATQYFEINFRTAAAREEALKKDFSYKDKTVTVSRTYPKDATIIRVSISDLPYEDETIIQSHMGDIFSRYGEILEMGLLYTVHGHWFTGRGFVTLNKVPGKNYAELNPQIQSWDDYDKLTLNYINMKPSCSRCHVTDHVFGNCPVMLRKVKTCYIYGQTGHLQAGCPEAWWNLNKTARKMAKLNANHKSPNQQIAKVNAAAITVVPKVSGSSNAVVREVSPVTQDHEDRTPVLSETPQEVNANPNKEVGTTAVKKLIESNDKPAGESTPGQIGDSEVDSDEEMESEVDDGDLDMDDATKEATETNVPLEQILATRRLLLKKAKHKQKKTMKQTKGNKELGRHSIGFRSGGIAKGQKQFATTSLKL